MTKGTDEDTRKEQPMEHPTGEHPTMGYSTMEQQTTQQPAMEHSTMEQQTIQEPTMEPSTIERPTPDQSPMGASTPSGIPAGSVPGPEMSHEGEEPATTGIKEILMTRLQDNFFALIFGFIIGFPILVILYLFVII